MSIRTVTMLAVVLLSLADCGSAGHRGANVNGSGRVSSSQSPDSDDQVVKFTECLRQNGMKIQDPAPGQPLRITGGPGASDRVIQTAMKACQFLMQSGGRSPANPGTDPRTLDAMLKYARCMRANGVDLPDPKPGQAQLPQQAPAGSQARIQAATAACREYLPGLPPAAPDGRDPARAGSSASELPTIRGMIWHTHFRSGQGDFWRLMIVSNVPKTPRPEA